VRSEEDRVIANLWLSGASRSKVQKDFVQYKVLGDSITTTVAADDIGCYSGGNGISNTILIA
jgi:hypothetical protein